MYININSSKLRISKIKNRFDYKQNELVYNGRVPARSYKDENCDPTVEFPAWNIWFQNDHCFVFFSYQLEQKWLNTRTVIG